jgi:hypothetical protein
MPQKGAKHNWLKYSKNHAMGRIFSFGDEKNEKISGNYLIGKNINTVADDNNWQ